MKPYKSFSFLITENRSHLTKFMLSTDSLIYSALFPVLMQPLYSLARTTTQLRLNFRLKVVLLSISDGPCYT